LLNEGGRPQGIVTVQMGGARLFVFHAWWGVRIGKLGSPTGDLAVPIADRSSVAKIREGGGDDAEFERGGERGKGE
jgi:hypothetical protein